MKENRLVKSQIPLRKVFFLKTNNNKQIGTIKTKLTEGANSATFGDCKGLFGWKVILLALDWELLGEDGTVRQRRCGQNRATQICAAPNHRLHFSWRNKLLFFSFSRFRRD
jgi:hypothetical protein